LTSDARERSANDGQPLYLLDFARTPVHKLYTTADRPIVQAGRTFLPAPISCTALQQTSELRKLTRTVTVASNSDLADWWRPYPPTDAVALTIYAQHYGETDVLVEWVGRVVSPSFNGAKLSLTCEPSAASAKRNGIKRCWQIGCPHALYSQGRGLCNVVKASRAVPATVTGVTGGVVIQASAFASLPDGRFAGGFVEWLRPDGLVETRSIDAHTGTFITVAFGAADLVPGLAVTAFPGCAQTTDDCTYYGNILNYGGDHYIPPTSPMNGNPVF
jgi:hypothetical protein